MISLFSFSTKSSECSQEDQVKKLVKDFLNSKPAEFYLRGINQINGKKGFKIIVNVLLTEINLLLNYS